MTNLEKEQLQKSILLHCQTKGITCRDLARKIGVPPHTLSNMQNGKFEKVTDYMLHYVWNKIDPNILAALFRTTDCKSVFSALEAAKEDRLMVGIIGDTGMGKSTACKAYGLREDVFYYEYTYGDTPKKFLYELLNDIGDKCSMEVKLPKMLDRLCNELNYLDNPMLIIDESSKLGDNMLMLLHSLRNKTKHNCGIALVGMPYFKNNLIKQVSAGRMGYSEFFRRINVWHELRGLLPDEIVYILEANGITDKGTQQEFRKLNRYGDLMNAITLHKTENS